MKLSRVFQPTNSLEARSRMLPGLDQAGDTSTLTPH